MSHADSLTWTALVLLGVFHGVNPAMGWLFAVALGLQERSRRPLLRALLPIAAGHELSVLLLAGLVTVVGGVIAPAVFTAGGALLLVGFGVYLLSRRRHFRWVGMRLTPLELGQWSLLMSTAHGAGLMLLPVLGHGHGLPHLLVERGLGGSLGYAAAAAAVHSAAMLVTTGLVALVVYGVLGTSVLRSGWLNVDRLWGYALVAAGVATVAWG